MIDHVSIAVSDLKKSSAFYEPILAELGFNKLADRETTVGFGKKYPEFWINLRPAVPQPSGIASGLHVCLRARDAETVKAFHRAAAEAGGTVEDAPKQWPEYSDNYFATFIQDPDGNRIEVVTFTD